MFGYVKPFKPELKICEFEAYKTVYCGLCGQLGKSFGPLARATLSYDFTFLSMLYLSLSDEKTSVSLRRCYVNPLKKTPCVKCAEDSDALQYGADAAVIMLYYKLLDNIEDSKVTKPGWMLLKPLITPAYRKAAKARPETAETVEYMMLRQIDVERAGTESLDEAANPTAEAVSKLCAMLSEDAKVKRVLSRFGYFLGRFIYISDALDDIRQDLKKGGYNPLILRFKLNRDSGADELITAERFAKESLYMTIGEAARAYDLLTLHSFKPVLDNIVALGLRNSVDDIFSKNIKGDAK